MTPWRGVVKHTGWYWTGTKPKWSNWRGNAFVFTDQEKALALCLEIGGSSAVRLRTRRERLADDHVAMLAKRDAEQAVRHAERERIARWFDLWLNLNVALLTSKRFAEQESRRRILTEGMVCVLKQAGRRIRAGRFQTEWEGP